MKMSLRPRLQSTKPRLFKSLGPIAAALVVLGAPGVASSSQSSSSQQTAGGTPAAPVSSPAGDEWVEGGLAIVQHQVVLSGGWTADGASDGTVAAYRSDDVTGASIQLDHSPTMVILDTHGAAASLTIRSRNNGQWSEWVTVENEPDEAPDSLAGEEGQAAAALAIGPIWIGDHSEALEVLDPDGSIEALTVEVLRSIDDVPAASAQSLVDPALAVGEMPAIQPRSAWADEGWAYSNSGCSGGPVYADGVRAVVVHHTVMTNNYDQSQVVGMLRGIYRTHVKINGWCDVGYNFVVDRFGTLWEARTGGVDKPVIGGHARGFNTWTSGIALLGQHQQGASPAAASPSQASLNAITALASWKLGLHGVDPHGTTWLKSRTTSTSRLRYTDGTWVEVNTILGHRDLGLTSCPGSYAYSRMASIRAGTSVPAWAVSGPADYQENISGPAFLSIDNVGQVRAGGAATYPDSLSAGGVSTVAIDAKAGLGVSLATDGTVTGFAGVDSPASRPAAGQPVADVAVVADGSSGYVLGQNGQLYSFNGASTLSVVDPPADAVAVDLTPDGVGYVLSATGSLHSVGGAPTRSVGAVVAGRTAVDVGVLDNRSGGWVLDSAGQLYPFGGAPSWQRSGAVWNGAARAVAVAPDGSAGWVLDSEGRLDVFGSNRIAAPLSTTVTNPTAVDVTVWWELRPEFEATADAKYVSALVNVFLGRTPDIHELDRLVWQADFEGRSGLADELANSDEWAGEIVDGNYVGVLGRPPEDAGRDYWVGRLRGGLRTQDLGSLFYSSPEYYASAGSNDAYVKRLYRALLHRDADSEGLRHWVGLLESGRARPMDISASFYSSIESRRDRVAKLYLRILGRGAGEEGLVYWSERLLKEDDIDLARELATSNEFYNRVAG